MRFAQSSNATALYARARRSCGDLVTAFELILLDVLEVAIRARDNSPEPLERAYPAYVLVEFASSAPIDLRTLLETFLSDAQDLVADGVIAQSRAQSKKSPRRRARLRPLPIGRVGMRCISRRRAAAARQPFLQQWARATTMQPYAPPSSASSYLERRSRLSLPRGWRVTMKIAF